MFLFEKDAEILAMSSEAPFCISRHLINHLPCGSGNDFVKNILSEQSLLDLSAQLRGTPVPLDLIRCNGNYVANVCNIGFDADIAYPVDHLKKRTVTAAGKYNNIMAFLYAERC